MTQTSNGKETAFDRKLRHSLFPYASLPKNPALKARARELRKQGILSEVLFWQQVKDTKSFGWDFDRQVVIGYFIVDFFIPELGLVFEIDGASHDDAQERDAERDAYLCDLRLRVVRIRDTDVLRRIDTVCDIVRKEIRERVQELTEIPARGS